MTEKLTILGIGGGLASRSKSELLLRYGLAQARAREMQPKLYRLAGRNVPLLSPMTLADPPPDVRQLLAATRQADALIMCTPVYHGTIAGSFKNAIDYLELLAGNDPPWLTGKVVGLMAVAATTVAGSQAITALEHVCRALRALTVPTVVVAESTFIDTDGTVRDAPLAGRVARMLGEIERYAAVSKPSLAVGS